MLNKEEKKRAQEYLNERYEISLHDLNETYKPNQLFYNGCLRMIEILGHSWERLENGKHIIY